MRTGFNEQIVLAEDKKMKRGSGINSILKFMSETIDFNDKLNTCVDSQDMEEIKTQIEKYVPMIEELYSTLSSIASGGIRSLNEEPELELDGEPETELEIEKSVKKKPMDPIMVNAPTIPTM